jgi:uncharacterized protein (TIGR02594 family)
MGFWDLFKRSHRVKMNRGITMDEDSKQERDAPATVLKRDAPGAVLTCWDLAERFSGLREVRGAVDNPSIMAMLTLDQSWPKHDEVPWCSAFVNYVAHLMRAKRSRSLMARSWLNVGEVVKLDEAVPRANDVVILWRGSRDASTGHVGFYGGVKDGRVIILGGNQSDAVNVQSYPLGQVLGVRRIL